MNVKITVYRNGVGPADELVLERGTVSRMLKLTLPETTVELSGLDLWRAVMALMSNPEAYGLKKDYLVDS